LLLTFGSSSPTPTQLAKNFSQSRLLGRRSLTSTSTPSGSFTSSVKQDDDAIFDDAFESHGKSPTLILKRQCRSCFSAMLSQNLTSINLPAFTAARIFATKKLCERSDGSWNIGAWGELEFG